MAAIAGIMARTTRAPRTSEDASMEATAAFLTAGSDIFCDDEGCYSKVESGALLQWDVALGLIIRL